MPQLISTILQSKEPTAKESCSMAHVRNIQHKANPWYVQKIQIRSQILTRVYQVQKSVEWN